MNRWSRWRQLRAWLPRPSSYWLWWLALAVVAVLAWAQMGGGR